MDLYVKDGKKYIKIATVGHREHRVYRSNFKADDTAIIPDTFITDTINLPPGLWLSTRDEVTKSLSSITCVSEIPDRPYDFTSIMIKRDDLATFITDFKDTYAKKHTPEEDKKRGWMSTPSNSSLALAIMKWLVKEAGITMGTALPTIEDRKIDPFL